ncbi:MAG TPA: hypothetical protein PK358_00630 [Spirochaetota bacterium]|nr:hypothetical protein [Spirochaetota bacterium]
MRLYFIFATAIILTATLLTAGTDAIFSGEEDTAAFYRRISAELLKDPDGDNSCAYIAKVAELSRDAGRAGVVKLFRTCARKLADKGREKTPYYFLFTLYSEFIDKGFHEPDSDFKGISKWLVSGPWQRYGRCDIDYPFIPEEKRGFGEFKAVRSAGGNGNLFPFGYLPERRGIAYAGTSFSAKGPVRIWVISNSKYRLFINGVKTLSSPYPFKGSVAGVSVRGAKNYTLLLKTADNETGDDPFSRVIVTDENNRLLEPEITGEYFRDNFSHEKIFCSADIRLSPGFDDRAGIINMRSEVDDNLYSKASALVKEHPLYSGGYHALVPALLRGNRGDEFVKIVSEYKKIFSRSDYYLRWEAEYYKQKEPGKFFKIMEKLHPSYCDSPLAGDYLKALIKEEEYGDALDFSEKFGDVPSFRGAVAEAVKGRSSESRWRKYLMEKGTENGDPLYFYYMGLGEREQGLDPLLYWEKALSIRSDMREVREASDIFENSSSRGSIYYSGRYASMQPEFLWNGTRRSVTVRIFESGRFMTECEDIIPASPGEKGEFRLLPLEDLRVLYVLKCAGGEAVPLKFENVTGSGGDVRVKVESGIKADFLVVKYTGYSVFEQHPFSVMRETELKGKKEDISRIELKVIAEGWMSPAVELNGDEIRGSRRDEENLTVYTASDNFNYMGTGGCTLSIKYLDSGEKFSAWYNGLLKVMHAGEYELPAADLSGMDVRNKIKAVKKTISSNFGDSGEKILNPGMPDELMIRGTGTTEEKAIMALLMLEKAGVRGFIAFLREKGTPLTGIKETVLFIPESKVKSHWLRFGVKAGLKNPEALVITKDGFEIIPFPTKVE